VLLEKDSVEFLVLLIWKVLISQFENFIFFHTQLFFSLFDSFSDPKFAEVVDLSNAMGLYLQKTNIIRDYLEDISQKPPRIFYPRDVWYVL
jgi:hypothetical protein